MGLKLFKVINSGKCFCGSPIFDWVICQFPPAQTPTYLPFELFTN